MVIHVKPPTFPTDATSTEVSRVIPPSAAVSAVVNHASHHYPLRGDSRGGTLRQLQPGLLH